MRFLMMNFLCAAFLLLSVSSEAEVVKMVDENGKVYYTNVVPGTNQSKTKTGENDHLSQYTHPNRALTDQEAGALSSEQIKQIEQEIDECLNKLGANECKRNQLMIHKFSTAMKWYIIHDKRDAERTLSEKWLQ